MKRSRDPGFTLIELLIVVAIIGILAAIAVPNFLEAQIRAKVARVKADMRTTATALEIYHVDNNSYPPDRNYSTLRGGPPSSWELSALMFLTSPVAYLSDVSFQDPFGERLDSALPLGEPPSYKYFLCQTMEGVSWGDWVGGPGQPVPRPACIVQSHGPDHTYNGGEWVIWGLNHDFGTSRGYDLLYNPSNGTVSHGDIVRLVGDTNGVPAVP